MSMMGTDEQLSARRIITDYLDRYGLGGLDDFVYNLVFRENVVSEAQLKTKIRETEVYRERFRGNEERREAGLNVYSEDRYIELENQYRYYRGLSGMPEGFYDSNDDIANFIANDVSPDEYYARINEGYSAVRNADPEVVGELQRLYGVNDSDLAQFFLDPERTRERLKQQAQTAIIAGEARQSGLDIGLSQAEELQRQGITQEQAQAGFQAIEQSQELFQATTGEQQAGMADLSQEEQIAGVFGTSGAAQQRLRQRTRRRQAAFEQGGRFAGQGAELTGLQ